MSLWDILFVIRGDRCQEVRKFFQRLSLQAWKANDLTDALESKALYKINNFFIKVSES